MWEPNTARQSSSTTPEQEAAARASKEKAQANFKNKIVTEITPASEFCRAEDYHQQYLEKRGLAHCQFLSGRLRNHALKFRELSRPLRRRGS